MNLKKLERYLRVNLLGSGPGPPLMKKKIYRAAVSQSLRNSGVQGSASNVQHFALQEVPSSLGTGTHFHWTVPIAFILDPASP